MLCKMADHQEKVPITHKQKIAIWVFVIAMMAAHGSEPIRFRGKEHEECTVHESVTLYGQRRDDHLIVEA